MERTAFEIRVQGSVPADVVEQIEEQVGTLTVTVEPAVSVLEGPVEDQAALAGLLSRLGSLGLEVTEVRRLPGDEAAADPAGNR